jgi:hypothetical protein
LILQFVHAKRCPWFVLPLINRFFFTAQAADRALFQSTEPYIYHMSSSRNVPGSSRVLRSVTRKSYAEDALEEKADRNDGRLFFSMYLDYGQISSIIVF